MDFFHEQNLINKGYANVCGIDEAGRGALAGPLVAGAVILHPGNLNLFIDVKDSKLLAPEKRIKIFSLIIQNARCWAIGVASNVEIDRHGLAFANKIAMKRAWKHLAIKPDYILSDYLANVRFETPFELIVKGDRKILSISAASIIAKVFRDNMMTAFNRRYADYGFEIHKGYGTALHIAKLKEIGLCDIHRKSFEPVRAKLL